MNSNFDSGEEGVQATGTNASRVPLPVNAIERRRLLLKGVGKGTALLAATAPLKTLAGQNLLTNDGLHQCSVSGMHSGVHSATPKSTPLCSGYAPTYWGACAQGATVPTHTWPTLPSGWTFNTPCRTVFTKSTLSSSLTLFQVLKGATYQSKDEYHWVCAWLNALYDVQSGGKTFPYSAQEVLNFYNAPTIPSQDALAFFKNYMASKTS